MLASHVLSSVVCADMPKHAKLRALVSSVRPRQCQLPALDRVCAHVCVVRSLCLSVCAGKASAHISEEHYAIYRLGCINILSILRVTKAVGCSSASVPSLREASVFLSLYATARVSESKHKVTSWLYPQSKPKR